MSAETLLQGAVTPIVQHLLEPLSTEEIAAKSAALGRERSLSEAVRFAGTELKQPVRTGTEGQNLDSEGICRCAIGTTEPTIEAVVFTAPGGGPVPGGSVIRWKFFSADHGPWPEDWPVMPVTTIGSTA